MTQQSQSGAESFRLKVSWKTIGLQSWRSRWMKVEDAGLQCQQRTAGTGAARRESDRWTHQKEIH